MTQKILLSFPQGSFHVVNSCKFADEYMHPLQSFLFSPPILFFLLLLFISNNYSSNTALQTKSVS